MRNHLLLLDMAKGTKSNYYHNLFSKTLKWSRNDIEGYQTRKLEEQIAHFYKKSSFFREKLISANIVPDDIRSLNDLKRIPPLTRDELKNHFEEMLSATNSKNARFSTSSGTTGIPVKYGKDLMGYSAGLAAGYLLWEMAGWKFSFRQLHIWGNPTSVAAWNKPISKMKSWVYNKKNIDSTLTNTPEGLEKVVAIIKKIKPESIDGYTSAIVNLATYIKENRINIPRAKIVITTAENQLPMHQKLIEETLGPVADLYGCGEINSIAIRKPNSSRYFLFDPHVFVETEDTAIEGLKEVLLTDLDNKLIPLIRYKIGDLIDEIKLPVDGDPIPFRHFDQIWGRSVDLINLPNGRVISPINMLAGTLFRKIGGIEKHKVLWNGSKLIFRFVTNSVYNQKKTETEIKAYLTGYEVIFSIEIVNDILPDKNGKYKYFERI